MIVPIYSSSPHLVTSISLSSSLSGFEDCGVSEWVCVCGGVCVCVGGCVYILKRWQYLEVVCPSSQ